ncbi:MAG: DUF6165 family protein [Xanthomonadales bacterium]|nr:DUF6165 family protein [Xanthomonadales bacterium]
MSLINVPVSFGELIDKITILEIKSERISDQQKLVNIRHELDLLEHTWNSSAASNADLSASRAELKSVNEALWEIEDRIRVKESEKAFDAEFIELARSVYVINDRRSVIKKDINLALGSELVEEKSYKSY